MPEHMPRMTSRIGVDIGGTFTDTAACGVDGILRVGKTLSTPGSEGAGVLNSIANSGVNLSEAALFVHGTTLVINALLERRGVRAALVTTQGFGDIVALGRGSRPEIYNPFYVRQEPYVPAELRFELAERMSARGEPVMVPTPADLADLLAKLKAANVQAVAVAFLHSYRNPDHEILVAAHIAEHLPDVFVTASSDLGRQWREYERFTTATANAYVGPPIRNYVSRLIGDLNKAGFAGDALFLDAGGGAIGRTTVERFPIRLVESGPVGGVIAAAKLARELDLKNVVTLDIGGTTAKASLIENGVFETLREYWVGGYNRGLPVQVPVVDIEEVGAGGGSIAWLDDTRLRMGPRSAGAKPGPAAYGKGGAEPTTTDALVHCGLFHPSIFLAEITLDQQAATKAIAALAARCGLTTDRLALGMLQLAHETTAAVVRRQTLERGLDPGSFTMIVSGGAGPGQACAVAQAVGIRCVLVPPHPGHFSAFGMLQSDLRFTRRALIERPLASMAAADLKERIAALTVELEGIVARDSRFAGAQTTEASVALRFSGQEHFLRLPLTVTMLATDDALQTMLPRDFAQVYGRRYGYVDEKSGVEVIDIEVVLVRELPAVEFAGHGNPAARPATSVSCLFSEARGFEPVTAIDRASLAPGVPRPGPLLVYEVGSITVVPPGWSVALASDCLMITRDTDQ
jgi:N-methylhydantoinase A